MSPPGFTGKLNLLTSVAETKLCITPLSTKATADEAASLQDSVHIPFHADAGTGFQFTQSKQEQLSEHWPSAPHALCTHTGNLNKRTVEEATERLPGKADGLGCKMEPWFPVSSTTASAFNPELQISVTGWCCATSCEAGLMASLSGLSSAHKLQAHGPGWGF